MKDLNCGFKCELTIHACCLWRDSNYMVCLIQSLHIITEGRKKGIFVGHDHFKRSNLYHLSDTILSVVIEEEFHSVVIEFEEFFELRRNFTSQSWHKQPRCVNLSPKAVR